MIITLKNEFACVQIDSLGAQLRGWTDENSEMLWCGRADVFDGVAPILFPFCGKLHDGAYRHGGKTFHMNIHGFARQMNFAVVHASDTEACFRLTDDERTRKIYPFPFSLTIRYALREHALSVDFTVKNCGREPMPFSLGAHYAFAAPGGVPGCEIVFEKPIELFHHELDAEGLLTGNQRKIPTRGAVLFPDYSICENNSWVFLNLEQHACTFINKAGQRILIEFPDSPALVLWTPPEAELLCIEPWNGRPDSTDGLPEQLAEKPDVILLAPGEEKTVSHTLSHVK